MKPDIKETIRNEYVHGYINDNGQRVMPTLDDLIDKKSKFSKAFNIGGVFVFEGLVMSLLYLTYLVEIF